MASTPSVRQRRGETSKKETPITSSDGDGELNGLWKETKEVTTSEWDYKAALLIIMVLAFFTRFWGIGHPNEVVFDEVHFGKVKNPWTLAS